MRGGDRSLRGSDRGTGADRWAETRGSSQGAPGGQWRRLAALAGAFLVAVVVLSGAGGLVGTASAANQAISDCTDILSEGTYEMSGDISAPVDDPYCIRIGSSNVTIDGQGHTVFSGDGPDNVSVLLAPTPAGDSLSNVTVKNLSVDDGSAAIYADVPADGSIEDLTVRNLTVTEAKRGIEIATDQSNATLDGLSVVDSDITTEPDDPDVINDNENLDAVQFGGSGENATLAVEIERTELNATDDGVDAIATGDGTNLTLSVTDTAIVTDYDSSGSGNYHGIAVDADRDGGTNDIEISDNEIDAAASGIWVESFVFNSGQTTNLAVLRNDVTSAFHGMSLYPRSSSGRIDAVVSDNDVNTSRGGGVDFDGSGDGTEVDLTVTDNDLTVVDNVLAAVDRNAVDVDLTGQNQSVDVEIVENEVNATGNTKNALRLTADASETAVDLSVTDNGFDEGAVLIPVLSANATADVEIRRNEFADEIVAVQGGGGPNAVLDLSVTESTFGGGLSVDLGDGRNSSLDAEIVDNDVTDENDNGIALDVNGANSVTNFSITDNVVESELQGLRIDIKEVNQSVEGSIGRNDINSSAASGVDFFTTGANSTVDLTVADNAINGSTYGMFFDVLGADAVHDVELLNNDVNVTGESTDPAGSGVRFHGPTDDKNTTLSLLVAENDVDAVYRGIDLGLWYQHDTERGGGNYDVEIAGNEVLADADAIAIEPKSNGMDASITITANVLDAEERGINLDPGDSFGYSDGTRDAEFDLEVRGNTVNTSLESANVVAGGDDTNVTVRILGNDLESEHQEGVYVDLSEGENGSRTVAVAGNNVTTRGTGVSGYGVYLEASATEAAADMNVTANSIDALIGLYLEAWADRQRVDQVVSGNEITADSYAVILYAEGEETEAELRMNDNVFDAGAGGSELNLGDPGATVDATVEANVIEADTLGIDFRGATILDADRFDVVVRENHVNASETGIEVEPEAGSGSVDEGLLIEHNEIRAGIRSVLLKDASAPVEGVELHRNVLEGGSYGIENENTTAGAYINATNNYWNESDGPDSAGPYEDPVTGTLADGSGSNVTNATGSTVANVHFDPWLSSAPKVDFDSSDGSDGGSGDTTNGDAGGSSSSVSSQGDDGPDPVEADLADGDPDEPGLQVPFDDGPIEELTFDDETLAGSGEVSVTPIDEPPEGVAEEFGSANVVSSTEIEVPDAAEDASATIRFRLSSSDLGDRDPESLQVVRVVDGENQRLTTEVNEDPNGGYVIEADTPGFSTFAVVSVQQQTEPVTDETPTATPETTPTTDGPASTATETPTRTETPGGLDGFGALAALVAIVVAGLYARRRDR